MRTINDNGRWIVMFEENETEDYEKCMAFLNKTPVPEKVPYLEYSEPMVISVPVIDENAIVRSNGIKGYMSVCAYYDAYKTDLEETRRKQLKDFIFSYAHFLKTQDFTKMQDAQLSGIVQAFAESIFNKKLNKYLGLQKMSLEEVLKSRQEMICACQFLVN